MGTLRSVPATNTSSHVPCYGVRYGVRVRGQVLLSRIEHRIMGGASSLLVTIIVFLSTSITDPTLAFQTRDQAQPGVSNRCCRSTMTQLDNAVGMDAYEAQLLAMQQQDAATITDNTSDTIEDRYATEIMNDSRSAVVKEAIQSTSINYEMAIKHNIGDLLMQRAIQTQLYYLSDLRDEPTYVW